MIPDHRGLTLPSFTAPPSANREIAAPTSAPHRPPPPLPLIRSHRAATDLLAIRTLDNHGRVFDRPIYRALGWEPFDRLEWRIAADVVLLVRSDSGAASINRESRLFLPASLRRAIRASAGDKILLAALVTVRTLIVIPPRVLDEMIADTIAGAVAGDQHGR